jgi:predicted transcriptional regulator
MENTNTTIPSITSIIKKISDDRALIIFNYIAVSEGDRYIPLREMNLTTKQYYSRISGLLSVGLIRRDKGKYSLTLLGKVVYDTQMTIGKALAYHWKLKAIESIEMSASVKSGLPEGELAQLVDTLIDNRQIKDILMKSMYIPSSESRSTASKTMPPIVQRITI